MARRGHDGTGNTEDNEPLLPLKDQHTTSLAEEEETLNTETTSPSTEKKASAEAMAKTSAALFYAIASLSTVFVMKVVLTSYGFPSALFLGLCQFVLTTVIFSVLALFGCVNIASPSTEILSRVAPLTIIFLLNVVTGLGGTKEISLPMFTVLRRFSILFTMLLESYVFEKKPTFVVKFSVGMMLGGAMVAAASDLSFHAHGYFLILANDACTAMYGVAIRYTLANSKVQISQNTLLLYNSAFGALALGLFMALVSPDELRNCYDFEGWADPVFAGCFLLAAGCGCVLNYAIFLCTQINSALTTTVIGCMKNVVTSYAGMFIGGDYVFSWLNFAGLNLSISGSIVYSYVNFRG